MGALVYAAGRDGSLLNRPDFQVAFPALESLSIKERLGITGPHRKRNRGHGEETDLEGIHDWSLGFHFGRVQRWSTRVQVYVREARFFK